MKEVKEKDLTHLCFSCHADGLEFISPLHSLEPSITAVCLGFFGGLFVFSFLSFGVLYDMVFIVWKGTCSSYQIRTIALCWVPVVSANQTK